MNYINRVFLQGGVFDYLYNLARLKPDDENTIFIVSETKASVKERELLNLNNIHLFDDEIHPEKPEQELFNEFSNFIHKHSIDLIIFHQYPPFKVFPKLSELIPSIYFVHNYSLLCKSKLKYFSYPVKGVCNRSLGSLCNLNYYLLRCMGRSSLKDIKEMKKILGLFNGFIVTSKFMKELLEKNEISGNKIRINNLFSTIQFEKYPISETEENIDILFMGRLTKEKGILDFLKKIPDKELTVKICGSGYLKEQIETVISKSFKNGSSADWIYRKNDIINIYKKSKIIIFPSIYPEPFGLVGLEAMLMKKPIVAFNVGGIGEWLKDGVNGFLIKENDWTDFNRKVIQLLNNNDLRRKMGQNAFELYNERFTFERHYSQLIEDVKYYYSVGVE
ncbi:MAG: glycosyltransferase family 4 protein [bacterium]|nr:glycosyltransferase family 4 protein [bacterium]